MPPPRKGQLKWAGDHWKARIRLSGKDRKWHHFPVGMSEAMAREKALHYSQQTKARKLVRVRTKPADGSSVADWFKAWTEVRRDRKGLSTTPDNVWQWNKHIAPVLVDLDMAKVSRADLERVVEALDTKVLEGQLSWKTARNVWGLVTKAFADAQRSKHAALRVREDNPAATLEGPEKGADKAKVYLYPDEAKALLSCELVPHWLRVVYALSIYTYTRVGELEMLTWNDVDLERGVIHIHSAVDKYKKRAQKSTKTKLARRIPIEPALRPLLEVMREAVTDSASRVCVLPSTQRRASYLRRDIALAGVVRADLTANDDARKHMTFHDLRATGTTWMALRGDPPMIIMQRAGHLDFATTQRYIREAESLGASIGVPFPALPENLVWAPDWAAAKADGKKHGDDEWRRRESNPAYPSEEGESSGDEPPPHHRSGEANSALSGGEPKRLGTAQEREHDAALKQAERARESLRAGVRKAVARGDAFADLLAAAEDIDWCAGGRS